MSLLLNKETDNYEWGYKIAPGFNYAPGWVLFLINLRDQVDTLPVKERSHILTAVDRPNTEGVLCNYTVERERGYSFHYLSVGMWIVRGEDGIFVYEDTDELLEDYEVITELPKEEIEDVEWTFGYAQMSILWRLLKVTPVNFQKIGPQHNTAAITWDQSIKPSDWIKMLTFLQVHEDIALSKHQFSQEKTATPDWQLKLNEIITKYKRDNADGDLVRALFFEVVSKLKDKIDPDKLVNSFEEFVSNGPIHKRACIDALPKAEREALYYIAREDKYVYARCINQEFFTEGKFHQEAKQIQRLWTNTGTYPNIEVLTKEKEPFEVTLYWSRVASARVKDGDWLVIEYTKDFEPNYSAITIVSKDLFPRFYKQV